MSQEKKQKQNKTPPPTTKKIVVQVVKLGNGLSRRFQKLVLWVLEEVGQMSAGMFRYS